MVFKIIIDGKTHTPDETAEDAALRQALAAAKAVYFAQVDAESAGPPEAAAAIAEQDRGMLSPIAVADVLGGAFHSEGAAKESEGAPVRKRRWRLTCQADGYATLANLLRDVYGAQLPAQLVAALRDYGDCVLVRRRPDVRTRINRFARRNAAQQSAQGYDVVRLLGRRKLVVGRAIVNLSAPDRPHLTHLKLDGVTVVGNGLSGAMLGAKITPAHIIHQRR